MPDEKRTVTCVKLQKELPGLDEPPWPGELGQRIYENVSIDAWKLWEERMKMILNEYRLMPWQKEAQELVAKSMEDFFFDPIEKVRRSRRTTSHRRRSRSGRRRYQEHAGHSPTLPRTGPTRPEQPALASARLNSTRAR